MQQLRIVTLLPSATEIVCSLGFEQFLVGRSHECDFPASVTALPVVSQPRFSDKGTSREIDDKVKAVLEEGLGVYRVDAELLEELKPTHIITQDHCQVCAVSFQDLEAAACSVISSRPKIVSLHPKSLSDVWRGFREIADALGVPQDGERLLGELTARMARVADRAASIAAKPTFVQIEWLNPLMSGGNWMPELIALAGGVSLFGEAGGRSPKITWEAVCESDPDVLFISPCGYGIDRTMSEIESLTSRAGWNALKAVQAGRVVVADGNHYFNRPGPRLAYGLELLAEMIHPEVFNFGGRGGAWRTLKGD